MENFVFTAATPHHRNGSIVKLPVEFLACFGKKHKSLSVTDYFWGVKCLKICPWNYFVQKNRKVYFSHLVQKYFLILNHVRLLFWWSRKNFRCNNALLFQSRQTSCEHRFDDQCDWGTIFYNTNIRKKLTTHFHPERQLPSIFLFLSKLRLIR
jgi:hypothetical protein